MQCAELFSQIYGLDSDYGIYSKYIASGFILIKLDILPSKKKHIQSLHLNDYCLFNDV